MKKNNLLILLTLTLSISSMIACKADSSTQVLDNNIVAYSNTSSQLKSYQCPDLDKGETLLDCPWASDTKQMADLALSGKNLTSVIKGELPQISTPPWKDIWGRSINYDENAHDIIVNPAIINTLENLFQVKDDEKSEMVNDKQIVHAGMEHTYGYLFSNLKTPYGYKRQRWVAGEIEKGFNLPVGVIGPHPKEGTLYTNATYFFGHIAFRDDAKKLSQLESKKKTAATVLHNFDFSKLKIIRLEETVSIKKADNSIKKVIIRTDFAQFDIPQKDAYLLVYSIYDSDVKQNKLITGFPVEKSFVERTIKADTLGSDKPITTR
ncbi:MAG: hypothetical protein H7263_16225, partial [Candidatus Sericytochromatia bacterium]|nr:hypothetical protein [Candidatus Sericytochromatia bacterium]